MSPVCRAFTRPKLIHGIEWRVYYLILLACMMVGFSALWSPARLLLLPLVYVGPYTFFRWAGKHDAQWASIYPMALRNRTIFFAHGDPRTADPEAPDRVIFPMPKFNP
jgi:type IV secretory pathway TrbD component